MKRNPIVLRKLPLFNTMSLITDTCHRFQFKKTCFEVRPFLLSKQLWLPDVKTRRWIHRFASFYSLTFINNLYSSTGNSSSLESILSALPRASIFPLWKTTLEIPRCTRDSEWFAIKLSNRQRNDYNWVSFHITTSASLIRAHDTPFKTFFYIFFIATQLLT